MNARTTPKRRRLTARERGSILLEFAIILPVFMGLIAATVDLGLGWKASITVSNAARAGARVASSQGKADTADYATLLAISASLGSVPVSEVDAIVIYDSTSATGSLPSTCPVSATNKTNRGVANVCNIYTSADVAAIVANPTTAANSYTGSCTGTRIDKKWCPSTRLNVQISTGGVDHVGVYIKINHGTSTKLFGSSFVIDDWSVMRIEPGAGDP